MKVAITGAGGFVGQALCHVFAELGHDVLPLTRQNFKFNAADIADMLKNNQPDYLIHTAGTSSVAYTYANPEAAQEDSIGLTSKVIEGMAAADTKTRLIYLSSAAVYGITSSQPIVESAKKKPISLYGEQKLKCEQLVENFSLITKTKPVIIRAFSLFGEKQKKLFLYEMFEQFAAPKTHEVHMKGTGHETRDFLSVECFAGMVENLCKCLPDDLQDCLIINVASGQPQKILDCAYAVKSILNSPKAILCEGRPLPGNPSHLEADTTLYNQIVSKKIPFDFPSELAKTIMQWKHSIMP